MDATRLVKREVRCMAGMDDHQLIRAIALKQDQKAFKVLFDRYQNKLYGLALRITHNPDMAEDAVQSALLAVWDKAKTYQEVGGKPSQWLFRIAAVESIKVLKVDHKQRAKIERKAAMDPSQELVDSPDRMAEKKDSLSLMRDAVHALPPLQQQLLALYYGGEMRQVDIGKALEMPQRTVSAKLESALAFIRKTIGKKDGALAAPVFGALLLEALGEGIAPRVDLWSGVTAQMNRTSGLPESPLKAKGSIFVAIAGVLAISGVLYQTQVTPRKEMSQIEEVDSQPLSGAEPISQTFPEPLNQIWDFSKPLDKKEFKVQYGEWTHDPKGGADGTGSMVIGYDYFRVDLDLDLDAYKGPLKLSMRTRIFGNQPKGGFKSPVFWMHYSRKVLFNNLVNQHIVQRTSQTFVDRHVFISDDFFDNWIKGRRRSLVFVECDSSKPKRLSILFHGCHEIDDLRIQQIESEALPSLDFIKPYLKRVPLTEGTGEIVFPELPSAYPDRQVVVKYQNLPKGSTAAIKGRP